MTISNAEAAERRRRHALINEAMTTAAQLQMLIEQVRITTQSLVDRLALDLPAQDPGDPT